MAALPAKSCAGSGKARGETRWAIGALGLVFAAELVLFWVGTAHHYAWIYPRWFDQTQYLGEAYGSYAAVGGRGLARASLAALAHRSAQGALHSLFGLWAFVVAGPSRTAALLINLLAFLALQAATFFAARRISGGYPLAWAAVGLLAALAVPWAGGSGSATDFRLDWMAACAYGVALATALPGRGFRSTGWAAGFGAAVGVVLLSRFLTAVYFGLIFLGFAVWILRGPDRWLRLARLGLAGAVAAACSGWAFWRSRHLIYDYYWVGHFGGPERALRDAHLGAAAALAWFVGQLAIHQLGFAALGTAAAAAFALRYFSGYEGPGVSRSPDRLGDAWAAAGIFFAAPALVLVLHPARAPQPLVILAAPFVVLVLLLWVRLAHRTTARALRFTALVVVCAGALVFGRGVLRDELTPGEMAEYRAVNAVSDFVHFRSEEAGLVQPRLAVTAVYDGLGAEQFSISGLERHGRLIPYVAELPTGLFEADPSLVHSRLAESDFVFLVTRAPVLFPFDREMEAMRPENRQWCDEHLRFLGRVETEGFATAVYERRDLSPTASGVDLPKFLAAASAGDPWTVPPPPGPPLVSASGPILWSVGRPLRFLPTAGYGPVRFSAIEVPAALAFAPGRGGLVGRFPQPGTFRASLTAANAVGSTQVQLEFRVVAVDWAAELDAPDQAAAGLPVELRYRAYDGDRHLDYIDVTDLTAGKLLARLTPNDDEHESWSGRFPAPFGSSGPHRVQFRFVRYDGSAKVPYTFLDREKVIVVGPDRP